MSASEWEGRRQAWTSPATVGAYEESRFASFLGRRKHANDLARLLAALTRHLPGPGHGLLDLPCGTGRLHADLTSAGYSVCGGDLSAEMLRVCACGPDDPVPLIRAEAERLPLATDGVDAVVSLRFLFHIRDTAARTGIQNEMARVARHLVIGQVRDPRSLKHRLRRLRRALHLPANPGEPALDREALRAELATCNLDLIDLIPIARLFSDKALFVARPLRKAAGRSAG